ncbi:protein kinase [Thermodesulfobacteriota bacterium]
MTENNKNDDREIQKLGFTRWLSSKVLGKKKSLKPVDTQFIRDLHDVEKVGRYEIIEKIGQGNMGIVYRGRDPYIKRDVAIKIARPAADVTGEKADKYRERFFTEAQSIGRLMHPNIVSIYDAGMYRDFCYIAMEYIDGTTLSELCKSENKLPYDKISEIILSTCNALDYAHQMGVIHRDIKPSNIMLNNLNEVRITDFGIAKMKTDHTMSGEIVGSPSYMSPEQVKEEDIDNVSDVFSVGCVLYELLTCQQAFTGENHFTTMYKITNTDPQPVREIDPGIPQVLEDITKKALSKEKSIRYQTCMDMAYVLRVALRGLKGGVPKKENVEDIIGYIHSINFFNNFSKDHVLQILSASNVVKILKGRVIMSEGEIDDSFYIILSGNAVVRKQNQNIARIGRGECFGEMAYLSGESRTATVTAETDCILLKISSMLLDKSSKEIQLLFLKKFAMTLLRRLSSSLSKK